MRCAQARNLSDVANQLKFNEMVVINSGSDGFCNIYCKTSSATEVLETLMTIFVEADKLDASTKIVTVFSVKGTVVTVLPSIQVYFDK